MTKLLENTFRAVNIALVNEFADICGALNIPVMDVIDAAGTKPFGFMRFNPGPGWGGHCIPLDPFYLAWKAKEYGTPDAKVYTDYKELLKDESIDVCYVLTPNRSHAPIGGAPGSSERS